MERHLNKKVYGVVHRTVGQSRAGDLETGLERSAGTGVRRA